MGSRHRPISATELVVLKVLWENGPRTAREIQTFLRRQGRRWAYTTVLTLLQRLEAKGHAARDTRAVAHVFRPSVSREKLIRRRLGELAHQVCGGEATPLVLALVQGHRFSPEEVEEFRRLLDRLAKANDER